MAEIFLHPIFYLLALFVAAAVVLPLLQAKAEETKTVLDDKIVTLLKLTIQGLIKSWKK